MRMRRVVRALLMAVGSSAVVLAGAARQPVTQPDADAPGAPGQKATWTNGNKQGVGTSVTLESKVWFTLGEGALAEAYYPAVDKAQLRALEFVVVDEQGFFERETTGGVGRLWPLLTGERGEYEVAAGRDATPLLEAMQRFANEGRMLPEQVWDRAERPRPHLRFGEGTGSATPLAWTNAQFIRLALSIRDRRIVEMPAVVRDHFAGRTR